MQVFISWSGKLSERLGHALREWLPSTLQYVKPYFTPADIEKGAKWDSEISKKLEESNVCIIALTRESLGSSWVMFEAGAISRSVDKARVCAILFGIEPTDIQGPLERFQATRFSKEDIHRLLLTINSAAGDRALEGPVLESVFEKWWPDLESTVSEILNSAPREESKVRSDKELLEETLLLVRSIASQQAVDQQASDQRVQTILGALVALQRYMVPGGFGSVESGGYGSGGGGVYSGSTSRFLGAGQSGLHAQAAVTRGAGIYSGGGFETIEGLPSQSRTSEPPQPSADVTKRSDK